MGSAAWVDLVIEHLESCLSNHPSAAQRLSARGSGEVRVAPADEKPDGREPGPVHPHARGSVPRLRIVGEP